MKVRFVRLGGGVSEVEVPDGSTVVEAAEKAGIDLGGMSLRISGDDIIAPGDKLPERDIVLLTLAPKVEGGQSSEDTSSNCGFPDQEAWLSGVSSEEEPEFDSAREALVLEGASRDEFPFPG